MQQALQGTALIGRIEPDALVVLDFGSTSLTAYGGCGPVSADQWSVDDRGRLLAGVLFVEDQICDAPAQDIEDDLVALLEGQPELTLRSDGDPRTYELRSETSVFEGRVASELDDVLAGGWTAPDGTYDVTFGGSTVEYETDCGGDGSFEAVYDEGETIVVHSRAGMGGSCPTPEVLYQLFAPSAVLSWTVEDGQLLLERVDEPASVELSRP